MKSDELIEHWGNVRDKLLETAHKFSSEDLEYVPFPNGYCVAELLLHVAHEEQIEVLYGITRELNEVPPALTIDEFGTLEKIEDKLNETHARTEAYLKTLGDDDMNNVVETPWGIRDTVGNLMWHVLEHEIHHRGELSLMLGLLGKKGLDA